MTVRVVRIMQYTYETPEQAVADMARWQVQGTFHPKGLANPTTITSAVLPMSLPEPGTEPKRPERTWQGSSCLECEADTTWCDHPPKKQEPVE